MLDYAVAAQERHERFIRRVVASGQVWGLKSNRGWCAAPSNEDDEREKEVMPFWSDRAYARQCAREEWAEYEPTPIPLDLFLDKWLPGIADDGLLVGTNWNVHLLGLEVEPLALKQEIEQRLGQRALGTEPEA